MLLESYDSKTTTHFLLLVILLDFFLQYEMMDKGPFGTFDHILQNRDTSLGQEKSDMETVTNLITLSAWLRKFLELRIEDIAQYQKL